MLRAEQEAHLRAAAFSNDPEQRAQHRGVFRWLNEWLEGSTLARYAEQAREKLGIHEEGRPGEPEGGSAYMESDGLEEE